MLEKLDTSGLTYTRHNYMAAFILQERKKEKDDPKYISKWHHFFNSLPVDCNDFPPCFTSEELKYLNGSPLKKLVRARKWLYEEEYKYLCEQVEDWK